MQVEFDARNGVRGAGIGGVGNPECVYCPRPDYSGLAKKKTPFRGDVVLSVVVLTDGTPTDIEVVRDEDPRFNMSTAAVDAVKRWRFKPARLADGTPVKARVQVIVTFEFS